MSAAAGFRIAAVVLAAGSSRRMGANKLLATIDGRALVEIAVNAALGSNASSVVVVTGHEADKIGAALSREPVILAFNADHQRGLASSLSVGLSRVPSDVDGVVVLLGDMPGVDSVLINRLIAAFEPGRVVVPVSGGRRGNPVLWSRSFFQELRRLSGDIGGRDLIEANRAAVIEVASDNAVLADVDTPEALAAVKGELS